MEEGRTLDYETLKRYSLFGGLTEEAFETLRPLIHTERFAEGVDIVEEGTLNDRVYFIYSGAVEVLKRLGDETPDKCRRITVMHRGDTFGEMELIDIQPCAATVRATEETCTLTLSNHDLYKVCKTDIKTYTMLIMNLARELSRRLRRMDDMMGLERPATPGPPATESPDSGSPDT